MNPHKEIRKKPDNKGQYRVGFLRIICVLGVDAKIHTVLGWKHDEEVKIFPHLALDLLTASHFPEYTLPLNFHTERWAACLLTPKHNLEIVQYGWEDQNLAAFPDPTCPP